jgi:hypothetical protein
VHDNSLRRFEAGPEIGGMHTAGALNCYFGCPTTEPIAGVHGSFNFNQYFAIDSSLSFTGNTPYDQGDDSYRTGGHASEFLFGAKGTARGRRWGLFASAEPGLLSWSHVLLDRSFAATPTPTIGSNFGRRNSFVIDLGGGVEFSPRPPTRVRIQVGDLLVRSNTRYASTYDGTTYVIASDPWVNQLQATGSISWAFGKPVAWTPPDIHQPPSHRFFDQLNIALITVSLLGQASDAITTQRFVKRGWQEGDPLAKPFVEHGWPGQIGLAVLDNAAELSVMYALHRMHGHRVERAVPIVFGSASGISAYRNDHRE